VLREKDRILGALKALATGDAIGKQTENLSRADIARWYPSGIRGFEGAPGLVLPRYAGNRKHEWLVGETTDDTERTMAVARAILRDRGQVRHTTVGQELLACRKCVHPGIKSLWEFHQAGDPSRIATGHDGCGAAVRVAPVGILYRSHRLDDIVSGAHEASIPTHGGSLARAAAAATAAAVSSAIDGAGPQEILDLAVRAAQCSESARPGSMPATFGAAIRTIHEDLVGQSHFDPESVAGKHLPNGPLTIVPLAIALATIVPSAEAAILLAANVGGDSDSVASIAGAILGARAPETVNEGWYRTVETVNAHELLALGEALIRYRS
jgi:ADP-ribosylglycohydrolase